MDTASAPTKTIAPSTVSRKVPLALLGPVLVWGLTVAMAGILWARIYQAAPSVPYWDEWAWAPWLTGSPPTQVPWLTGPPSPTWKWVWEQHNDHRIPVAKLFLLAFHRLTNGDSRLLWFLHGGLLTLISTGFVLTARRLRGRIIWTDALFPLLYLHLGHWESTFSCGTPGLFTATHGALLAWTLATLGPHLSERRAILIGVLAAIAPVVGMGVGLFLGAVLGVWLLVTAVTLRRGRPGGRRLAAICGGFAGCVALVLAVYAWGWQRDPRHPPGPGGAAALTAALEVASSAFGARGALDALGPDLSFPAIGAFVLVSVGLLLWHWWHRPDERLRTGALLALLGSYVAVVLGMGWGRSGLGPGYFASRYAVHAAPLLALGYLAWEIAGPRFVKRVVQGLLVAVMVFTAHANYADGDAFYRKLARVRRAFNADVARGLPIDDLARRYDGYFLPGGSYFRYGLGNWQAARRSVFRDYRPGLAQEWTTVWQMPQPGLGTEPGSVLLPFNQVVLFAAAGALGVEATGEDPSLLLPSVDLATARLVLMRIEIVAPARTKLQVFHSTAKAPGFSAERCTMMSLAEGLNRRRVVLFDSAIAEEPLVGPIRLDPGMVPGRYLIRELALEQAVEVPQHSSSRSTPADVIFRDGFEQNRRP